LGPHHLAFFRGAVLYGLDPLILAQRYLPVGPLERLVKAELQWIRRELQNTARRMKRRQLARILAQPLPPLPRALAGATLEDLARQYATGFGSAEELRHVYRDAYAETNAESHVRDGWKRAARRLARAIDCIEGHAVVPPRAEDRVEAWLPDGVANAMRHANIRTLGELAALLGACGARWYREVRGLGPVKAATVGPWLRANVPGLEQRVSERALIPYKELRPTLLAERRRETGVVPFEWFEVPEALDGRACPRRPSPLGGGLAAVDDRDAVNCWLRAHLTAAQRADPVKNSTYRAYRKEIERLWAWAVVERGKALSALDDNDAMAYATFLHDPQPRAVWVGPKRPRWHPEWRPFIRAPSSRSRELSLAVVNALFTWWVGQGYIVRNPWTAVTRESPPRPKFTQRSLSLTAWNAVQQSVTKLPDGEKKSRVRALLALLYASGLRREELAAATVHDLRQHEEADGSVLWNLDVLGKGDRRRSIPLSPHAVEALCEYYAYRFDEPRLPTEKEATALFSTLPVGPRLRAALSGWGINEAVREIFRKAARAIETEHPEQSTELRCASVHWLRHTFAAHAVKYDGANLVELQKVLGHASVTTTARNYAEGIERRGGGRRRVTKAARLPQRASR
jgi:site-specific recombinase XerD